MSITLHLSAPVALPDDALRQMLEFGPDVMLLLRPDGRCRHASGVALPVLGRPPSALVGMDLVDLVLEADQPVVLGLLAELKVADCGTAAFRMYSFGEGWTWMEANARRLPGSAGIVMALRDITARKQEEAVLVEANDLLRRRATLDPVTCLPNRGHFLSMLERELRRANREETSISLLCVAVDEFAQFNDVYGRDAGDLALREVAVAVEGTLCRPGDLAGRLEGAMLGVLLPATDLRGAAAVAERVRQAAAALRLEHAGEPSGRVMITLGLSCSDTLPKGGTLLREAMCEIEVARAATASCLV